MYVHVLFISVVGSKESSGAVQSALLHTRMDIHCLSLTDISTCIIDERWAVWQTPSTRVNTKKINLWDIIHSLYIIVIHMKCFADSKQVFRVYMCFYYACLYLHPQNKYGHILDHYLPLISLVQFSYKILGGWGVDVKTPNSMHFLVRRNLLTEILNNYM